MDDEPKKKDFFRLNVAPSKYDIGENTTSDLVLNIHMQIYNGTDLLKIHECFLNYLKFSIDISPSFLTTVAMNFSKIFRA